ncbi:MAG TPA: ABC transporter permease [Alphaproteobacteria bacterium]|jgi:ABC-type nitrate/sulfonate/bicarbonate transport system permease component
MAGVSTVAARPAPAIPKAVVAVAWGVVRWLPFIVFLGVWEAVARSGAVTTFMLPSISLVAERIWTDAVDGDLTVNLGLTLYRALTGFMIASLGGIVLGILIARSRSISWFFDPVISAGFPMPKIAFLPIVVLWFGFYDQSKIFMIIIDAIFPVVTATIAATRGVEKEILWSARNLGASDRQLLWEVILPASLPQILTGLQIAMPISLIVCIIAEMLMGGYGIGGAMIQASRFANSPGVFAGLIEIAIVGYALVKIMAVIRRRLLLWHQEAMQPTTV